MYLLGITLRSYQKKLLKALLRVRLPLAGGTFSDPYLVSLIETALANNQEFNIAIQDIEIATSEVKENALRIGLKSAWGLAEVTSDHPKIPRKACWIILFRIRFLDTLIST